MASAVPLNAPRTDPAPVLDLLRTTHATELLVAAVAHLGVFGLLSEGPLRREDLRDRLHLADRAAHVLVTALRAMGLLAVDTRGRLTLSTLAAEHLGPGSPFDLSDYAGLAAAAPGVLSMVERLRTNRPLGMDRPRAGTAFISRAGSPSAMEHPELARHFTLALAGRADLILLSNVLHDWDVPDCRRLAGRCAAILPPCGKLVVHDTFLHDELDGPLAVALYSAALFSRTEGRAYSAAECATRLREAGLTVQDPIATLAHSSLLVGWKRAGAGTTGR